MEKRQLAARRLRGGVIGTRTGLSVFIALTVISGCGGADTVTREQAVKRAAQIYAEDRARGMDFSSGPCISNGTDIDGWVIDIAHRPRKLLDDLAKNQCSAYLDGTSNNFVELDPKGRLIRTSLP